MLLTIIIGKPVNTTLTITANCLPTNLQKGVIAFYTFISGSLTDYSGNSYNLTNLTTATSAVDRDGNPNCAFNFIAANGEYLKYSNPTFLDNFQNLPFSISLWYKPLLLTNGAFEVLIGRDTTFHCSNNSGQWSVSLYDFRKAVFGINQYSLWDAYINKLGCEETIADLSNTWQNLVVTSSGINLKLYRNGILTSKIPLSDCSTNIPSINAGDLFLGKDYTGLLDDVLIYDHILSQSEINQLYALPACCK